MTAKIKKNRKKLNLLKLRTATAKCYPEAGFDYVCEIDGIKLFRKRK